MPYDLTTTLAPATTPEERQAIIAAQTRRTGQLSIPEQNLTLDQFHQQQQRQKLIGTINQFFNDPRQEQTIQDQVGAMREVGLADAQRLAQQQEQAGRFQRAASGTVGGSNEAVQLADVQSQLQQNVAQTENAAQQTADQMRMRNEQQRNNEILSALAANPFLQEAYNKELEGYGVDLRALQQADADRQRLDDARRFADDEYSRVLGNLIDLSSQTYTDWRHAAELRAA